LNRGNAYYKEVEGEVFPMPGGGYDYSIAADIRNEKCNV
jgi:hypothetical protein